jgi:hypothetical protein
MEKAINMDRNNDNDILINEISSIFNSYFGNVLDILSARFPHIKGDGSDNEHQFMCLRSKILRAGNDKIRNDLVGVVKNYNAVKIYNTNVSKINVWQRTK